MKRYLTLGVVLFGLLLFSGCRDWSDLDLSGERLLEIKNDIAGDYYKPLVDFEEMKTVPVFFGDYYNVNRLLGFFGNIYFRDTASIGGEIYHYAITVTNREYVESNIQIVFYQNGRVIRLGLINSQSLPDHLQLKDPRDLSWTNDEVTCSGKDIYYFNEPFLSKIRLISTYNLRLSVTRKIKIDENGVRTIERTTKAVKLEIEVKIGNPQYLYSQEKINDAEGKTANLHFAVGDRNLDGAFDNQDSLKIWASWGIFEGFSSDWLPFGRSINFSEDRELGSTYIFDLIPGENSYLLDVKKVDDEN